jgi:hypothetical protein
MLIILGNRNLTICIYLPRENRDKILSIYNLYCSTIYYSYVHTLMPLLCIEVESIEHTDWMFALISRSHSSFFCPYFWLVLFWLLIISCHAAEIHQFNWILNTQLNIQGKYFPLFIYLFFYLCCCAEWGYIVSFTKFLTIYQKYHTWNYSFHYSPLTLCPPFLE